MKKKKINSELALKLKEDYSNGYNISELAEKYDTYAGYVSVILRAYDVELRANSNTDRKHLSKLALELRNKSFKDDYENGMSIAEIALKHDVAEGYVRTLAKMLGVKRNKAERNMEIVQDYENGMSIEKMAEKYSLSTFCVYRLAINNGATKRNYYSSKGKAILEILEKYSDIDLLQFLTDREQVILSLRLGLYDGETKTLEEVGKEFGVTRERIRQIEHRAFKKLVELVKTNSREVLKESLKEIKPINIDSYLNSLNNKNSSHNNDSLYDDYDDFDFELDIDDLLIDEED